jgi:hypothetical protein
MSNPDWYLDPPEEPENPRCPECDDEMTRINTWTFGGIVLFECHNPECSECEKAYRKEVSNE